MSGSWSAFGAPSLKWVGVCTQSALQSVFRKIDSWSNRLTRAVGSLVSDLSTLVFTPHWSTASSSKLFCNVLMGEYCGPVTICPLLTRQWQKSLRKHYRRMRACCTPFQSVFTSVCRD